jgi:hypothetical protein
MSKNLLDDVQLVGILLSDVVFVFIASTIHEVLDTVSNLRISK